MTPRQRHALQHIWPQYGLKPVAKGDQPLNLKALFGNTQPCIFEIGFGMGGSLLAMAHAYPNYNFLGADVHLPGVGALLADMADTNTTNIRVFCDDIWSVFPHSLPDNSLHRIQIFFPDPWPKRRHHKRRLVNQAFIEMAYKKLTPQGCLHAATDWEPYALEMLKTLDAFPPLVNQAGSGHFSPRPPYRPLTKYEQRGKRLGHGIWDLMFIK